MIEALDQRKLQSFLDGDLIKRDSEKYAELVNARVYDIADTLLNDRGINTMAFGCDYEKDINSKLGVVSVRYRDIHDQWSRINFKIECLYDDLFIDIEKAAYVQEQKIKAEREAQFNVDKAVFQEHQASAIKKVQEFIKTSLTVEERATIPSSITTASFSSQKEYQSRIKNIVTSDAREQKLKSGL